MDRGNKASAPILSTLATIVLMALILGACTGSATIDETTASVPAESTVAEATVAQVEPTAVPVEPTSVPAAPRATPVEPTAEATSTATLLPAEAFRTDTLLGLSNTADHAYAGTSSPWNTPTSCGATPAESVAVVSTAAAAQGEWSPIAGGLEQAGDVRELLFSELGRVAVLSSCGEPGAGEEVWMHTASVADDGSFVDVVGPIQLQAAGDTAGSWLERWVDDDTVEISVIIEVDPDDFESWIVERRHLTPSTGQGTTVAEFSYYDDNAFFAPSETISTSGITYREIDDPGGAVGCEGFGIARTIELDDGVEARIALGADGPVFSAVEDLHIATTGHIAWTSGCEGFTSGYVGKLRPDGSITDAHLIEAPRTERDTYTDFSFYRLSNDATLVALGVVSDATGDGTEVVVHRFDLTTDPSFVNTADPAPAIEDALLVAANGRNTWHVGETLGQVRACGGKTLYGLTENGFIRAFSAATEIDAIVDADVGETIRVAYDTGDYVSRTVVFSTICPGDYEGRRVWFGIESDTVNWGLALQRADMEEVREVLSVRDQFQEDSQFVEKTFVEVELIDGTITEIELVAVPFEG